MTFNKNSFKMDFVTGGCFFAFTTKVSKELQSVNIIRFWNSIKNVLTEKSLCPLVSNLLEVEPLLWHVLIDNGWDIVHNEIERGVSGDEPPHQMLLYTHLFSLFHYFLYTADHHYAPLLMQPHTWHDQMRCDHMRLHLLVHNAHLCFIRPALLIWWTDVLRFTCFISIPSSPTCALPQPDKSQILALHGQALSIASFQMSLVLTFLLTICI